MACSTHQQRFLLHVMTVDVLLIAMVAWVDDATTIANKGIGCHWCKAACLTRDSEDKTVVQTCKEYSLHTSDHSTPSQSSTMCGQECEAGAQLEWAVELYFRAGAHRAALRLLTLHLSSLLEPSLSEPAKCAAL